MNKEEEINLGKHARGTAAVTKAGSENPYRELMRVSPSLWEWDPNAMRIAVEPCLGF